MMKHQFNGCRSKQVADNMTAEHGGFLEMTNMNQKRKQLNGVVNVASVAHRSPFRYPGGKTWLVPRVRKWLTSIDRPVEFIEPFAGGGIVGLSALFDGLVDRATFVEIDPNVAAVWRAIVNGKGKLLAERILKFEVTETAVRDYLAGTHKSLLDQAFATILRNRMQRGGIMAPGAGLIRNGEKGKGLLSRWYPKTLHDRLIDLHEKRASISFLKTDGVAFLLSQATRRDAVFFIDPPYTVAGARLYTHSEIDDDELFRTASQLTGDFLMTYDNAGPVRDLAKKYNFDTQEVAMKNTHHAVMSELLIAKDLDWVRK